MKKTNLIPPYSPTGKTNFPTRKKSGVYLIYQNHKLVYVGYSQTDVYKTMYRHFQFWNDKSQVRVIYPNWEQIKVRIVYCSPLQADRLEKALILKYKPRDNPNKYYQYLMDYQEQKTLESFEDSPIIYTNSKNAPF